MSPVETEDQSDDNGATAGDPALPGRRRPAGARLPDRLSFGDTALLAIATHKASRLLTKDKVTAALRVPFARHLPVCLAIWVSTGMVFAPGLTRLVATMLTAVAASDTLQIGYDAARQWVQKLSS